MSRTLLPPTLHKQCGARAGLSQHRRVGEWACEPCRAADAIYQMRRGISRGTRRSVQMDAAALGYLLSEATPEVRQRVTAALRPGFVNAIVEEFQCRNKSSQEAS